MRLYRVEDMDGNGPFMRRSGELMNADLVGEYTVSLYGVWGMANQRGNYFSRKEFEALPNSYRLGCRSMDELRLWFPHKHSCLKDFAITVFDSEEFVEAKIEVAFNRSNAIRIERVSMEVLLGRITDAAFEEIQQNRILHFLDRGSWWRKAQSLGLLPNQLVM